MHRTKARANSLRGIAPSDDGALGSATSEDAVGYAQLYNEVAASGLDRAAFFVTPSARGQVT